MDGRRFQARRWNQTRGTIEIQKPLHGFTADSPDIRAPGCWCPLIRRVDDRIIASGGSARATTVVSIRSPRAVQTLAFASVGNYINLSQPTVIDHRPSFGHQPTSPKSQDMYFYYRFVASAFYLSNLQSLREHRTGRFGVDIITRSSCL